MYIKYLGYYFYLFRIKILSDYKYFIFLNAKILLNISLLFAQFFILTFSSILYVSGLPTARCCLIASTSILTRDRFPGKQLLIEP